MPIAKSANTDGCFKTGLPRTKRGPLFVLFPAPVCVRESPMMGCTKSNDYEK